MNSRMCSGISGSIRCTLASYSSSRRSHSASAASATVLSVEFNWSINSGVKYFMAFFSPSCGGYPFRRNSGRLETASAGGSEAERRVPLACGAFVVLSAGRPLLQSPPPTNGYRRDYSRTPLRRCPAAFAPRPRRNQSPPRAPPLPEGPEDRLGLVNRRRWSYRRGCWVGGHAAILVDRRASRQRHTQGNERTRIDGGITPTA